MFDDAQFNQSAKLTLVPRISGVTLSTVRIVVPSEVGAPGSVVLSGAGATGAASTVSGQIINITTAAATTAAPLEVTIGGLVTPVPTLQSDNGNYPLVVSTSASGGILTPIASQAPVRVVIPVSALRDVDSEGAPLDAGAVVAVEGTVTEADFGGGAANFSGFIQDGAAGINIFSPSVFLGLVRGNRFTISGTVSQSNGLTAVIPTSAAHIVDRGPVTEASPISIPLAALFASPETYEGRLVTVKNLTYDSGVWGPAASITLRDSSLTPVEIRIQSGSTATSPPPFPATVTGIFSQSDATAPFDSGYQILPRDSGDLIAWVDDFVTWTTTTGATGGPTGDPDFDGKDNSFEYAFGLNPTSGSSSNPVISGLNPSSGKFTYTRRSLALTARDVQVFTSTNLTGWTEDTTATESVISTAGQVETVEVTLSAPKPLTAPTLFFRVELN
jgi:hypothetical protein